MFKSLEAIIGGALVLAALLLFLSGMMFRLLSLPLSGGWVEEVTIYLVAWGILMSAAGCVANGDHVRADFLLRGFNPKTRYFADILAAAAGLAFCGVLAWFGWEVVTFALRLDERGPSFLQIPTAWYYAALPTSMIACSLRYFIELAGLIQRGIPAQDLT